MAARNPLVVIAGQVQELPSGDTVTGGGTNNLCSGRLTLTSGTPVTTADVTAATTLYFTPYKGNTISLYDGSSSWVTLSFSELSLAVPATTSQMYDIFAYNNSGVVAIEALAWTSDTARATAIALQNGILVKSGATTRRYLGSMRTTTVSGQTEDSLLKRYVWNRDHQVMRRMQRYESAATWAYTSDTVRQANGSTSNQVDFIIGYEENPIEMFLQCTVYGSTAGTEQRVSFGLDSITAFSSDANSSFASSTGGYIQISAFYNGYSGVGKHYLSWLEGGAAAATFFGYQSGRRQAGMTGYILG